MQENVTYNLEKNFPVETDLEMTQSLEMTVKNFKPAVLNTFQNLKDIYVMSKTNGESQQKDWNYKRNHIEIMEPKNEISGMKNYLDEFNNTTQFYL